MGLASSQINIPLVLGTEITRLGLTIPNSILWIFKGRETNPHVTVQYGLIDCNPDAIREAVRDLPPFNIRLGKLDFFEGVEGGMADALYISVADSVGAGGLVALRNRLKPFINPDKANDPRAFVGHITLAYLNRGALNNKEFFKGISTIEGATMKVCSIIYSDSDRNQHECELKTGDPKLIKPLDIHKFYNSKLL